MIDIGPARRGVQYRPPPLRGSLPEDRAVGGTPATTPGEGAARNPPRALWAMSTRTGVAWAFGTPGSGEG